MVSARRSNMWGGMVMVLIIFCCSSAWALDGSGTEGDPWLIQSLADFNDFASDANYWTGFTRLETDVNLAGRIYDRAVITPDVNNEGGFQGTDFKGVFDGNYHKILNLTIDDSGTGNDYLGLFGRIGDGEVENLGLKDASVKGTEWFVGGLLGFNYGSVSNCYSTGDVSGYRSVGGLMGWNCGSVSNCYSTGSVSGDEDVGGLVGYSDHGIITNCYFTGDVSGDYYVGGLVGVNWFSSRLSNCYSTGDVNGVFYVGGLVGWNCLGSVLSCYSSVSVSGDGGVGGLVGDNWGSLSNCYSSGSVIGDGGVGGLLGENCGVVSNCYSTGDVSGDNAVGGLVGKNHCGSISNCYSICNVNGVDDVGGLVGINYDSSISNCYSTCSVSGNHNVGGLAGSNSCNRGGCGKITKSYWDIQASNEPNMCGSQEDGWGATGCDPNYGLPTYQLHQQSTFTDWDFINAWNIGENQTYPYLRTVPAGDINKDGVVNFFDAAILCEKWMEE